MRNFCDFTASDYVIDQKKTGNNLKELIKSKFGTIPEFCENTGFPYSTVKKWIEGKNMPSVKTLCALSGVFGVPMDNMIKRSTFCETGDKNECDEQTKEWITSHLHPYQNFIAFADVVLLAAFLAPENFEKIIEKTIDCNSPTYVFQMLLDIVEVIKDIPEGRHVIRMLQERGCPLVDEIELPQLSRTEKKSDENAYRFFVRANFCYPYETRYLDVLREAREGRLCDWTRERVIWQEDF